MRLTRQRAATGITGLRGAAVVVLLALVTLAAPAANLHGEAAAQPQAPSAVAPPPGTPVDELAARAAEVPGLLDALTAERAHSAQVETIRERLSELRAQIDRELKTSATLLAGRPTLYTLQDEHHRWQARKLETDRWLAVLKGRATVLQEALRRLSDIRSTWRHAREAAAAARAPDSIFQKIDAVLAAIDAARAPLEAERAALLDLQIGVVSELARSRAALTLVTQAQEQAIGQVLVRERPAMWTLAAWAQTGPGVRAHVREIAADRGADLARYVGDPSRGMWLHLIILAALVVVFGVARRRVRRPTETHDDPSSATAVFDRPHAAALVVTLLLASAPSYSTAPLTVRGLFQVLLVAVVIRLTRPVVDRRLVPELYVVVGLFALDNIRQAFSSAPALEQAILVLEMCVGVAALAYSLTVGGLRRAATPAGETGRLPAFRVAAILVLLILSAALAAGASGYTSLARLLASGVLGSGALAVTLYACVRVLVGVVAFALRVWPLGRLHMVEHHRDLLERRSRLALGWLAVGAWLLRSFDYVGLFEPVVSAGGSVLAAKLGRGSIQVSVGDVLAFALTLWVAYLASAFIRFVLSEDVYPRTRLTRGIAYATSSLLNYVIISLGFVLALGALGFDVTKLTILVGAFGVGIGFGLQSVVNNFVSGLILLFERPIKVGDIVEVGDLSGEVARIGIRASTVRTQRGAEIIVPNAQLITERVTNWTLSDRTRRIDLPVGVDYGSPPEQVVAVLEAVARAHPEIMQSPAPRAVFMAFGDSAITFELRAWTSRIERWPTIQTELAAAVYAALHAAGMSLPLPQREVRLLSEAPPTPKDPATP